MSEQHWTGGTTVSREHTELHATIYGYFGSCLVINAYKSPDQQDHELTDVILAAGYRKPRTITTAEELDALPDMTVVRTDAGSIANLVGDRAYFFAYETSAPRRVLALPATVLYEPEEGQ